MLRLRASSRPDARAPAEHRRLKLEQLEARRVLDGGLVSLTDDAFNLRENGPQTSLDVLANDTFDSAYSGARLITSVSYGSEGGRIAIAVDQRSIQYTPPADFFGAETFVYAVDGRFTATVTVSVQAPLTFDAYEVPPDGLLHDLDVLANDSFWPGYAGPRLITAVSVGSAGGDVQIAPDGQSVWYTPPDGAFGKETFVYVVDDLYPAQVTIQIPQPLENDRYEIVQHDSPQVLEVLANDPFWANYAGAGLITHVTEPQLGTVEIASDGRSVIYTPGEDHGWESFRYVVDGSYEAFVSVRIHRPVRNDAFEVDRNSTGYYYNLLANDTYRDLNNLEHDVVDQITSVTQPGSGGVVSIAAGGQGVYYTPPMDFYGSDSFSYLADGAHLATVTVHVTRPVRSDQISTGVYQDTPGGLLDVLANDFIGNGYSGPGLITAVGPTTNGGQLTISGDGRLIYYTPADSFSGYDQFSYTVDGDLEAIANVYVRPLARTDWYRYSANPPHGPYTLDVLANDYFQLGYAGPGVITAATIASGDGQVAILNGQTLSFSPALSGTHLLRYTVDDKYEGVVSVSFPNHLTSDRVAVDQNSLGQQLYVLSNDFQPDPSHVTFKSQDYTGPRLVTQATNSDQGGVVAVASDGLSVTYTPPGDFVGTDRFTYTVDGFMTATVSVEVIRRVRDDAFRVDAEDGQQRLPVLVNDLLGANYAGPGHVTDVTSATGGVASIAADGRSILYQPNPGFVGTDVFTYTVDNALKAEVQVVVDTPATDQSPTFGSFDAYAQFLIDDALVRYQNLFGQTVWVYPGGGGTGGGFGGTPNDNASGRGHSETNVQVAGVDEGDIIEFDADFVYTLTDSQVVILDAWPAEELSVASRVDIQGRTIAQFLHGDRLTVISEAGGGYLGEDWLGDPQFGGGGFDGGWGGPYPPAAVQPYETIVTVIDVADRTAPAVVQVTRTEGKYVDSRGVADFVYVLVSNPDAVGPAPEIIDDDDNPDTPDRYETEQEYLTRVTAALGEYIEAALPNYSSYDGDGQRIRTGLLNLPQAIHQPLVADAMNLVSVISFNVEADAPGLTDTSAVYSTGAGAIYASLENFYVFDADTTAEDGAITRIAKFDWDPTSGGVDFAAATSVAGSLLNQFSADENGPYLRIMTTVSNSNSGNWSGREENTLFVLAEDDGVFEFVGSLQNLALDETIRSVRFLGDRAFVSTFRDIDPLFALDLADPANPQSVGHITLPGFTSYMHLLDANHLLTVGRNTPVGASGPTQVAVFDIADLHQPLRTAEYTFERFSTSEAELDHHAFGYYAEHGLLGMPVSRTYYERVDEDGDGYRETRRAVTEHELAILSVDATAGVPSDRIELSGVIQHGAPVRRSGYIGDKLYSMANDAVKVVDIAMPDEVIAEVILEEPSSTATPGLIDLDDAIWTFEPSLVSLQASQSDATLKAAVERARQELASRTGAAPGAAVLVTAESAPGLPGGGYFLVFRLGEQQFLYRASDAGLVSLVDDHYDFAAAAHHAWHAVAYATASPAGVPGDANLDGRVDQSDYAVWRTSFGTVSLVSYHPADGNGDGIVNSGDYTVWRDNLGAVDPLRLTGYATADYNRDGVVDRGDYLHWRLNFGATSGAGLAADGNSDGVVDAADYSVWRDLQVVTSLLSESDEKLTTTESLENGANRWIAPDLRQAPTGVATDAVFALAALDARTRTPGAAPTPFVRLLPSDGHLAARAVSPETLQVTHQRQPAILEALCRCFATGTPSHSRDGYDGNRDSGEALAIDAALASDWSGELHSGVLRVRR